MLKTTKVKFSAEDLRSMDKHSIVDRVDGNSEVGGTKPGAKPQTNSSAKLTKFKNTL